MSPSSPRKARKSEQSRSTTNGTSPLRGEQPLELSLGTVKRLLVLGYERYEEAFKTERKYEAMYWDGYIRALHHVLEANGQ